MSTLLEKSPRTSPARISDFLRPIGTRIPNQQTGIRVFGGPIVTASGLVITAGAEDL